ncbi:MAG: hypothetical protein FWD40_06945 [Treponema sp.]|nr:hypothetical protein [Treponema sp.]
MKNKKIKDKKPSTLIIELINEGKFNMSNCNNAPIRTGNYFDLINTGDINLSKICISDAFGQHEKNKHKTDKDNKNG